MLSHVQLFATPWAAASQAPLSMEILQARMSEWVPRPPPAYLPNPGTEPRSHTLYEDLPAEPQGSLQIIICKDNNTCLSKQAFKFTLKIILRKNTM